MNASVFLSTVGFGIAAFLMLHFARSSKLLSPIFLFSAVHAFFIFPKVIALTVADNATGVYFRRSGIDLTVAATSLTCFLAFILVYRIFARPTVAYTQFQLSPLAERAVYRFAVVVGAIGFSASVALVQRNGGVLTYYTGGGFYSMEFFGSNVWLIFISRLIYPAITCLFLLSSRQPKIQYIFPLIVFALPPALNAGLLFRRSDLLFLAFIAFYAVVYVRRPKLSRVKVVALSAIAFVAIIMFPFFRQELIAQSTGWDYGTSELTFIEKVSASFVVSEDDEIVRAAATILKTQITGDLQYGAFIWNSLVDQFVPSALFGPSAKQSLKLTFSVNWRGGDEFYDFKNYYYLAPMGFADAYAQLGGFGFIIFGLLGAFVARIEKSSGMVSNRVFLIVSIPIVCLAATNDITSIPARLLTYWIVTRFLGRSTLQTHNQ